MAIKRHTLRAQIREELLARMRNGEVQPGEGINEVKLAAELGVSRTPLREALIILEGEGQVESEAGLGFRFLPLSRDELVELAPILAALEGLALDLSPVDELAAIGLELARLAGEFTADVARHSLVISKDDEWHGLMLGACPNRRLLGLIAGSRQAFHRYESLLVPGEAMIGRVAAEHAEIARCLVARDIPGAKAGLRVNWLNAAERLIAGSDQGLLSA
jgi:DNA-binding GntR family transcriptional regulator